LSEKYITITLVDRLTDKVILEVQHAAVDNQEWVADVRGLVRGSFTWEGIYWIGEND
jgi:hypothetical protein